MTRPALHNHWGERKRRAATVKAWRAEYGDICPGYQRTPHNSPDLCADHLTPVGVGGAEDGPLTVLCRSCNSRKRDGRKVDRTPTIRSRAW